MKTVDLLLINPPISRKHSYDPVELEAGQIRVALCNKLFERYSSNYSLPLPDWSSIELIDPPTGLLILSSVAKNDGYEVGLIDFNAIQALRTRPLSKGEIEREISSFDPCAIGITSFSSNHHIAMRILKVAKGYFPNSTTVYGGVHATFTDVATLKIREFVDCVVRGEAEPIISPLLRVIKRSSPLKADLMELPGVTFRLKQDTIPPIIVRNPDSQVKPDLNEIPMPDYELLNRDQYRAIPFFHIFGQRGCVYNCTFCANVLFFGQSAVRHKKPERVIEEIKLVQSLFGNKVFMINDDTFTLSKKYTLELCQALKEAQLGTCFHVQSRVDKIDEERLEAMEKAQVVYIWLGCESADPRVLKIMNKGINPVQIEDACTKLKKHYIDVGGYWLIGSPGENFESIRHTRSMITSLIERDLMDVYEQSIFVPYPGTPVYENPGEFDVEILSRDFRRYREDIVPIVRLRDLAPEDVYHEWLKTTREANEIYKKKS